MKDGKRDYKRELAWEHKSAPNRVKDRAQRNGARSEMKAAGKARVGDGKDVGHKTAISKGGKNTLSNLAMQLPSENRSFARTKGGAMRSETSKREAKRR